MSIVPCFRADHTTHVYQHVVTQWLTDVCVNYGVQGEVWLSLMVFVISCWHNYWLIDRRHCVMWLSLMMFEFMLTCLSWRHWYPQRTLTAVKNVQGQVDSLYFNFSKAFDRVIPHIAENLWLQWKFLQMFYFLSYWIYMEAAIMYIRIFILSSSFLQIFRKSTCWPVICKWVTFFHQQFRRLHFLFVRFLVEYRPTVYYTMEQEES